MTGWTWRWRKTATTSIKQLLRPWYLQHHKWHPNPTKIYDTPILKCPFGCYKMVPRTRHNTCSERSYDHLKFDFSDFFASFWVFLRICGFKPSGSGPTGLSLKYVTLWGFSVILNTIGLISRYIKPKNLGSPQIRVFWAVLRCQEKYHFWECLWD